MITLLWGMLYGLAEISSHLCLLPYHPQTLAHIPLLPPRALHPSLWMDPQPYPSNSTSACTKRELFKS